MRSNSTQIYYNLSPGRHGHDSVISTCLEGKKKLNKTEIAHYNISSQQVKLKNINKTALKNVPNDYWTFSYALNTATDRPKSNCKNFNLKRHANLLEKHLLSYKHRFLITKTAENEHYIRLHFPRSRKLYYLIKERENKTKQNKIEQVCRTSQTSSL